MNGAVPLPALVGFHDLGRYFGSRFLRRGFRHVLVAVNDGRAWVVIDPRLDRIVIDASLPAHFDLALAWREAGLTVVATTIAPAPPPAPSLALAPMTCVAVVKRVLGLTRARILTPFALYRHLIGSLQHGSIVQSPDTGSAATAAAAHAYGGGPGAVRAAPAPAPGGVTAARSRGQHPHLGAR
jgi:hypothetical protein